MEQPSEHLRLRIPFQGRLLRPREEPALPLETPTPFGEWADGPEAVATLSWL